VKKLLNYKKAKGFYLVFFSEKRECRQENLLFIGKKAEKNTF